MAPRLSCAAFVAASALLVSHLPGEASAPGVIAGRVRLGIAPAGRPLPTSGYGRQISVPAGHGAELPNVLVWLKDPPARPALPARQAILRQRGESFLPHVLAIPAGSSVTFPNDDPIFHNVFSLSRAATFDLGRYRQGDARTRRFTSAGLVKVFCHLHSHMSAIIAVFDHPWFAQVGEDGTFAIQDVPPGRYTLTGWHERAGGADHAVIVESGVTTRVELLVPLEP